MMKMLFRSFYAKLSASFLVLLLLVGLLFAYINYHSSMQVVREAEQVLNRDLATNMARELEPNIKDSLQVTQIKQAIHFMMVHNPKIEIYLLDPDGKILAFFADPPQKVQAESVDLSALQQYLKQNKKQYILGPDPRHPDVQKPFSAARVEVNGESGYLYIILGGEEYDTALSMVRNSYILQTSLTALGGALMVTALLGLGVFFVLTRRLSSMADVVDEFEQGNLQQRIPVKSEDEIGQLAHSFNSMADSMAAYIDKIQNNDRMRRELVANISHDLRSPLASIQGYLETILMKGEELDPKKRRDYLDIILKNTTDLSKLIEDLFALSKLEAKQVEPQLEPVAISELCQDVVMKFQPEAEQKVINMMANMDRGVPFVKADIALIERALSNLLRNAISYTSDHGKVNVKTEQSGDRIRVSIMDTGIGIAPDDLPHIFDRFYRGNGKQNRPKGSSGLGLAIAQKIVQLHGSEIEVQSEPNVGTVFSFELPVYRNGQ
jgi:signal transduction histidine kinase